jgi:hypothetical protein
MTTMTLRDAKKDFLLVESLYDISASKTVTTCSYNPFQSSGRTAEILFDRRESFYGSASAWEELYITSYL